MPKRISACLLVLWLLGREHKLMVAKKDLAGYFFFFFRRHDLIAPNVGRVVGLTSLPSSLANETSNVSGGGSHNTTWHLQECRSLPRSRKRLLSALVFGTADDQDIRHVNAPKCGGKTKEVATAPTKPLLQLFSFPCTTCAPKAVADAYSCSRWQRCLRSLKHPFARGRHMVGYRVSTTVRL